MLCIFILKVSVTVTSLGNFIRKKFLLWQLMTILNNGTTALERIVAAVIKNLSINICAGSCIIWSYMFGHVLVMRAMIKADG